LVRVLSTIYRVIVKEGNNALGEERAFLLVNKNKICRTG